MFLPRISRYIFAELVPPSFLALFVWTFFLLMNHFFVVAEKALSKGLSLDLTLRLLAVGIPKLLVLSIPMAVLLGALIGVGRFSSDHEWIALQAAGYGPMRVLRPIVAFGLASTLVSFLVYAVLVPRANYDMRTLRGEILLSSSLASDLRPRVFYSNLPNTVLFVEDIRAASNRQLRGVVAVKSNPEDGSTELYLARAGDLYPAPNQSGALVLDLYDGYFHRYNTSDPSLYRYGNFEFNQVQLDVRPWLRELVDRPEGLEKVVQDLSPAELWTELGEARAERSELQRGAREGEVAGNLVMIADHRVRVATIEFHQRLALPLACLLFAVLALPLGITRVRSGKGAAFALSLLVILIYYAVFKPLRNQAALGNFPVVLGAWSGNLVIAPWALYALWRLRRPASDRRGVLQALLSVPQLIYGWIARHTAGAPQPNARVSAGEDPDPRGELGGTPNRFVTRVDRYVGLTYLRVLVFAMASAYLIYALVEMSNLSDAISRSGQPAALLLRYLQYFAPGVLPIVLPISCMIAAVVTFTLLGRSGELLAVKAAGISMRRATAPVVLLTLVLGGLLFLVQDRISPTSNQKAQAIKDQIQGRPARSYWSPSGGRWAFGPQGRRLYHYRHFDPDHGVFQGMSAFNIDTDTPRILDHRFSRHARWDRQGWELRDGWYRSTPLDPSAAVYRVNPGLHNADLDPPDSFATRDVSLTSLGDVSEQMSLANLLRITDQC